MVSEVHVSTLFPYLWLKFGKNFQSRCGVIIQPFFSLIFLFWGVCCFIVTCRKCLEKKSVFSSVALSLAVKSFGLSSAHPEGVPMTL